MVLLGLLLFSLKYRPRATMNRTAKVAVSPLYRLSEPLEDPIGWVTAGIDCADVEFDSGVGTMLLLDE